MSQAAGTVRSVGRQDGDLLTAGCADTVPDPSGAVAQLVERRAGSAEVRGSTPLSSTDPVPEPGWDGWALAGFVAAEGSFVERASGTSSRRRFAFELQVAARDRLVLETLREAIGAGSITDEAPRRDGWQPMSRFAITSHRAHVSATIPFMDRFLITSRKRLQYETWRASLLAYAESQPARRRSLCRMEDCDRVVRGRMLCRRHYYRATGY